MVKRYKINRTSGKKKTILPHSLLPKTTTKPSYSQTLLADPLISEETKSYVREHGKEMDKELEDFYFNYLVPNGIPFEEFERILIERFCN